MTQATIMTSKRVRDGIIASVPAALIVTMLLLYMDVFKTEVSIRRQTEVLYNRLFWVGIVSPMPLQLS